MDIIFDAWYGDVCKRVSISQVDGMGGEIWHIMIDNRYHGMILKRWGEWVVLEQIKRFEIDDMQIMIEMVEKVLS